MQAISPLHQLVEGSAEKRGVSLVTAKKVQEVVLVIVQLLRFQQRVCWDTEEGFPSRQRSQTMTLKKLEQIHTMLCDSLSMYSPSTLKAIYSL